MFLQIKLHDLSHFQEFNEILKKYQVYKIRDHKRDMDWRNEETSD